MTHRRLWIVSGLGLVALTLAFVRVAIGLPALPALPHLSSCAEGAATLGRFRPLGHLPAVLDTCTGTVRVVDLAELEAEAKRARTAVTARPSAAELLFGPGTKP